MSFKSLFLWPLLMTGIFILFSYVVAKEGLTHFDFDTTVKIQDAIPHSLDQPLSYLSLLGSFEFTTVVLVLYLVLLKHSPGLMVFFVYGFALVIELLGKLFIFHPGPPKLFFRFGLNYAFPSAYIPTDFSYPSGHVLRTTFLCFFGLSIVGQRMLDRPYRIVFTLLSLFILTAMMVSRVSLGEHWPSDVIGGFLLGSAAGAFAGALAPLHSKKQSTSSGKNES